MRNRVHVINSTYKVIPDKGIVVCILECTTGVSNTDIWSYTQTEWWSKRLPNVNYRGDFTVRAKAICCKDDKFDEVIGKRIAESRAKAKAYRTAYKFWSICAKNIGNMVKFCNSTASACSVAFCKEEEHVKELSK
jgi:hypothetical protein